MISIECVDDAKARVGETALWDAEEAALFWADIDAGRLFRFEPGKGPVASWDIGEKVGCLAIRRAGGAMIATESGIYSFDFATGDKLKVADPEADRPENRFNDCVTDRQGRWWIGSYGMMKPQRPEAAFYRMDADGTLTRWLDGIYTTNGLAFSPDGKTMYFSDSHPDVRTVWAADYDIETGTPSNQRMFFDTRSVAGRPDGGTVDVDGCYWMAGVGGWQVLRITPEGKVDLAIDMPVERPSKPAFGGPDMKTLYVTSIGMGVSEGTVQPQAGGLFAITGLPVGGLPSDRFAG